MYSAEGKGFFRGLHLLNAGCDNEKIIEHSRALFGVEIKPFPRVVKLEIQV
jgi:hypothetical protein